MKENKQINCFKCECGALVSTNGMSEDEVARHKDAGCAICYLKRLLEQDIKDIDEGRAV